MPARAATARYRPARSPPRWRLGQYGRLQTRQLLDATLGQAQQRVQLPAGEGHTLGRALHLHETPRTRHDDVHIDLGPGVLDVGQVEHRHTVDDADRYRGHRIGERVRADGPGLYQAGTRIVQRHVGTTDGCRAGAAVSLQRVAVDGDLHLAQHHQITHG